MLYQLSVDSLGSDLPLLLHSHISSERDQRGSELSLCEVFMSAAERPLILGLGGTPRPGSSSERALEISLRAAQESGAEVVRICGEQLMLPIYTPNGARERTAEIRHLVESFRRCEGVIIASPAYHGSVSGMIKNALDYTEDLSGDERVYFDGLAVGLVVCAAGWQAAGQTLSALRAIAHALRGWPTPLGAALNTSTPLFDEDGACLDLSSKFQLEAVGRQVAEFAHMRRRTSGPSGLAGKALT